MQEMDEIKRVETTCSSSDTVAYAPEVHVYPTNTTDTVTTVTPASHMNMEEEHHDDQGGTLERLVKPEDITYEVSTEEVEEKDQQPLGIVESCFPYLARRGNTHSAHSHSHGHVRPTSNQASKFGFYPGMKSCFVSVGLMEEDGCTGCAKTSKNYEGDSTPLETINHAAHETKSLEDRPLTTVD